MPCPGFAAEGRRRFCGYEGQPHAAAHPARVRAGPPQGASSTASKGEGRLRHGQAALRLQVRRCEICIQQPCRRESASSAQAKVAAADGAHAVPGDQAKVPGPCTHGKVWPCKHDGRPRRAQGSSREAGLRGLQAVGADLHLCGGGQAKPKGAAKVGEAQGRPQGEGPRARRLRQRLPLRHTQLEEVRPSCQAGDQEVSFLPGRHAAGSSRSRGALDGSGLAQLLLLERLHKAKEEERQAQDHQSHDRGTLQDPRLEVRREAGYRARQVPEAGLGIPSGQE
mmetsp:Transcript_58121/g.172906  ORF Transcript_58121/g.172906 Transcript_58121/m.172906 type:complete len:281 (+) Transcript_58121:1188-2030(+)